MKMVDYFKFGLGILGLVIGIYAYFKNVGKYPVTAIAGLVVLVGGIILLWQSKRRKPIAIPVASNVK